MKHALWTLLALSGCLGAQAQSSGRFTMVRSVIAGGGTTFSTGGSFTLGSTLGQPTAGLLTGSRSSLQAGFWMAPPFLLFAPVRSGGGFSFSFETTAGRTYTVESTDSLLNPSWQPLQDVVGDGTLMTVTGPVAVTGERYHRVRFSGL